MTQHHRSGPTARAAVAALNLLAVVALAGCAGSPLAAGYGSPSEPARAPAQAPGQASAATAVSVLESLPIKGRAPKTGYDRDGQFGTPWLDVDHNGCDTRNDVLARDLLAIALSGPCTVISGTLADPYTATTIDFQRGNDTSALVQIDHLVALSNAWQTGAQQLSPEARAAFANDPLNLLAVDGPTNGAKGSGDAATWLPPNTAFRCEYVARQVAVKAKHSLWLTQPEHDAMLRVLGGCPGQAVEWQAVEEQAVEGQAAPPATGSAPPPPVHFANCTEARAAGAAPLTSGDAGYSRQLDRDGDGRACES